MSTKPYYEVVSVDDKLAAKYLAKNFKLNRRPSERKIEEYEAIMKNGAWEPHSMPIAIASDGELLNGQHRLMAAKRVGKPVEMVFLFNAPKSLINKVDTGKSRTPSDLAHMAGFEHTEYLTSTINEYAKQVEGFSRPLDWETEIRPRVEEHREALERFVSVFEKTLRGAKGKLGTSPVRAAILLAYKKNPDAVASFVEKFSTGANHYIGSPVLALRDYLINNRTTLDERFDATLCALRYYLDGDRVLSFRIAAVGRTAFGLKPRTTSVGPKNKSKENRT